MHKACFAAFALLAACTSSNSGSGGSPGPGGDPSAWSGAWNETGTQSTTCGGASNTTQLSQTVAIQPGSEDNTIETDSDSCQLVWDLDGGTANLASGQICTVSVDGVDVTVEWTQSTATLASGQIAMTATGATNNGCSFMQQATLTKS